MNNEFKLVERYRNMIIKYNYLSFNHWYNENVAAFRPYRTNGNTVIERYKNRSAYALCMLR